MLFFFFSSRRRHTRSLCDWSSDVCSSDLVGAHQREERGQEGAALRACALVQQVGELIEFQAQEAQAEQAGDGRSEEHTSELQSHSDLVCRLLLEKKE